MLSKSQKKNYELFFGEYWEISTISIIRDKGSNTGRWFAFVEFKNVEDATRAKLELNGVELFKWQGLNIQYAKSIK